MAVVPLKPLTAVGTQPLTPIGTQVVPLKPVNTQP